MQHSEPPHDPLPQSELKNYTTSYEWFFPHVPKIAPHGNITWIYEVQLKVPQLAKVERQQVLARFHLRLEWLSRILKELEELEVTDQLVWRCLALTHVQIQQTFFDLENVGFLLMANGEALGQDMVRLHELLQKFRERPPLPDMVVYYQLPAHHEREGKEGDPCSVKPRES